MRTFPACTALMLVFPLSLAAVEPTPEITREPATPQAVGAAHTARQIPEACARIEGAFTSDAAEPYRFAVVRTSPQCQPRARFVDYAKAHPSEAAGWKLNDVIRIPSAACPSQQAIFHVWRKPGGAAAPKPDGQGQTRIYLEEAKQQAAAGQVPQIPMYAAQMKVEGKPCSQTTK